MADMTEEKKGGFWKNNPIIKTRALELQSFRFSATVIAEKLNSEFDKKFISRNAVIGLISRAGLKVGDGTNKSSPKTSIRKRPKRGRPSNLSLNSERADIPSFLPRREGEAIPGVISRKKMEPFFSVEFEEPVGEEVIDFGGGESLEVENEGYTIQDLNGDNCHWPLGGLQDRPPFFFCGEPQFSEGQGPYCKRHYIKSIDRVRMSKVRLTTRGRRVSDYIEEEPK